MKRYPQKLDLSWRLFWFPLLCNKSPQNVAAESSQFCGWAIQEGLIWAVLTRVTHALVAVRCQLGLQSSKGSTELDIQDGSQHMASNWWWLLARCSAGAGDQSTYLGSFNKAISGYPGSLHGRWLSPEQAPQENQPEAVWLFMLIFRSHTALSLVVK